MTYNYYNGIKCKGGVKQIYVEYSSAVPTLTLKNATIIIEQLGPAGQRLLISTEISGRDQSRKLRV